MTKKIAVINGDGAGPELVQAMLNVLKATDTKAEFIMCEAGSEWWEKNGGDSYFPKETWNAMEESDVCFKGPTTTTPTPGTPKSVAVTIRQHFDLYANIRPIKTFTNHVGPLGEVDFIFNINIVRTIIRSVFNPFIFSGIIMYLSFFIMASTILYEVLFKK